jgi:GNAT superfamily N-acetyltransferase
MARPGCRYGDAVPDLVIRPYEDADEPAVLELLAASLGKTVDDRYRGLFRWKHLENPFGRSLMWVGEVDDQVAGFRAFLRWRFLDGGSEPVQAVRAVDTATHPEHRGMGIFSRLTLHAIDEMRRDGIAFVFNTPNDQSRPGYLKMGWVVEGRVPVQVRPCSLSGVRRMLGARTAAETWSLPLDVGEPLGQLDVGLVDGSSSRGRGEPADLRTDRTPDFVRWRYAGCPAVASRGVPVDEGVVVVRCRSRGSAIECTVGDVLGSVRARHAGAGVRSAMRQAGADYAIASTSSPIGGMLRTARLGPVLTRRPLSAQSPTPLCLSLGDLELF